MQGPQASAQFQAFPTAVSLNLRWIVSWSTLGGGHASGQAVSSQPASGLAGVSSGLPPNWHVRIYIRTVLYSIYSVHRIIEPALSVSVQTQGRPYGGLTQLATGCLWQQWVKKGPSSQVVSSLWALVSLEFSGLPPKCYAALSSHHCQLQRLPFGRLTELTTDC